jgi:hypothetical protein
MDGVYIGDKSIFKHVYARRFLHDPELGVMKYADYLAKQVSRNVAFLEAMVRLHWHGVQYGELILRCSCKPEEPCHGEAIKQYMLEHHAELDRWYEYYKQIWTYRGEPEHLNSSYYWNMHEAMGAPIILQPGLIYVFGSNLSGIHGKGAALEALRWYGAKLGKSEGYMGRSYALPTKAADLSIRSLEDIAVSVDKFLQWQADTGSRCYVTPVGCGLAGYLPKQIAPLFNGLRNSWVARDWYPYLL